MKKRTSSMVELDAFGQAEKHKRRYNVIQGCLNGYPTKDIVNAFENASEDGRDS